MLAGKVEIVKFTKPEVILIIALWLALLQCGASAYTRYRCRRAIRTLTAYQVHDGEGSTFYRSRPMSYDEAREIEALR